MVLPVLRYCTGLFVVFCLLWLASGWGCFFWPGKNSRARRLLISSPTSLPTPIVNPADKSQSPVTSPKPAPADVLKAVRPNPETSHAFLPPHLAPGKKTGPTRHLRSKKRRPGVLREVTAYVVGRKKGGGRNICISASGENVCEALKRGQKRCAANFAALGSLLHIEGHGTYLVTDRLHRRYRHRVDIAMGGDKYQQAIQFGLKRLHVTELAPAEDKPKEVVSRRGQTPLAKSSKKKGQKRRLG